MKISLSGRKLIKRASGWRMNAYQGRGGIWMIGYGTIRWPNGVLVKEGDKIKNEQEADDLLSYSLQSPERIVNTHIKARLTQNQYDALVSFVYDVKGKVFNESGIIGLTQVGAMYQVPEVMLRFVDREICSLVANSRTPADILKRRTSEADLFKML